MLRALLFLIALAFAQIEQTPLTGRAQPMSVENAARIEKVAAVRGTVTAFAWSPSGSVIAVAHGQIVSVTDVAVTLDSTRILDMAAPFPTLLFDPRDPSRLLLGRYRETQVRDIATGYAMENLVHPDEMLMAAGDPIFATAHGSGWALLRQMDNPDPIAEFNPLTDVDLTITQIAFSPDLQRIALATSDGLWMWNILEGEHDRDDALLSGGYGANERSVAFSPDGRFMAAGGGVSAGTESTMRLWALGDDGSITMLDSPPAPTWEHPTTGEMRPIQTVGVAFHPRGDLLAAAGEDGLIRLYEVTEAGLSATPVATLDVTDEEWFVSRAVPLAFNAEGTLLAVLEPDGVMWLLGVREDP